MGAMVDQILRAIAMPCTVASSSFARRVKTCAAALLAEPFQRGQLDAAFAKLRASEADTAAEAHAILSEVAQLADATERDRIAGLVKGQPRERPVQCAAQARTAPLTNPAITLPRRPCPHDATV